MAPRHHPVPGGAALPLEVLEEGVEAAGVEAEAVGVVELGDVVVERRVELVGVERFGHSLDDSMIR